MGTVLSCFYLFISDLVRMWARLQYDRWNTEVAQKMEEAGDKKKDEQDEGDSTKVAHPEKEKKPVHDSKCSHKS